MTSYSAWALPEHTLWAPKRGTTRPVSPLLTKATTTSSVSAEPSIFSYIAPSFFDRPFVRRLSAVLSRPRWPPMASPAKSSTVSPRKSSSPGLSVRTGRERSSSIVKVEKVGEQSQADALDLGVYENLNAEWVNRKGVSTSTWTAPAPHTTDGGRPTNLQAHGSFIPSLSSPARSSLTLSLACARISAGR